MKHLSFFLLLLFISATQLRAQGEIRIAADLWMPYSGDGTAGEGYLIDTARAIFETAGYRVEYSVVPWARALMETRNGAYTAIAGVTRMDAEGLILPETVLGKAHVVFFVNNASSWRFNGLKSLEGITLGVCKGYTYNEELDAYIKANAADSRRITVFVGPRTVENMLEKLKAGQVDAIVDFDTVISYLSRRRNMDYSIRSAGTFATADSVYLAFSPKSPEAGELSRVLEEGMKRLRATGELSAILAVYGLKDWK